MTRSDDAAQQRYHEANTEYENRSICCC